MLTLTIKHCGCHKGLHKKMLMIRKKPTQKIPTAPPKKQTKKRASRKISQHKQTSKQTKRSIKQLEIFLESKDINTKLILESKVCVLTRCEIPRAVLLFFHLGCWYQASIGTVCVENMWLLDLVPTQYKYAQGYGEPYLFCNRL